MTDCHNNVNLLTDDHPVQVTCDEAEAAARALWSGWDRMDHEEKRVLLIEVFRALGAAAMVRRGASVRSRSVCWAKRI